MSKLYYIGELMQGAIEAPMQLKLIDPELPSSVIFFKVDPLDDSEHYGVTVIFTYEDSETTNERA